MLSVLSGKWPLQRLSLIPRRSQPYLALLVGRQYHGRGLRMYRRDDRVRLGGEEAIHKVRSGIGFDLVPRSPLYSVQMPAKLDSARSPPRANQTTSFLVFGFVSGEYSAKLLNGATQRCSGLSQMRQCGDDVLRMLVTGAPGVRGGGGIPHRIITISRPPSLLRITGAG